MKPFLHERIFYSLLLELASGYYPKNSRFISLRKASSMFRSSKPTTAIAYQRLCDEGYLIPSPRSGYRVTQQARSKAMLALQESKLQFLPPPHDWKYKRARIQSELRPHTRNVAIIYFVYTEQLKSDIHPPDESIHSLRCSRGCLEAAMRLNINISFACFDGNPDRLIQLNSELKTKPFDGVIVIQRNTQIQNFDEITSPLVKKGIPVISLFGQYTQSDVVHIDFNNTSSAYKAIQIMHERGIRKIIVPTVPNSGLSQVLRLEGCKLAAEDFGLEMEIFDYDISRPNGGLTALLKKHRGRQVGILALFHDSALAVKRAADRSRYHIPNDISLIGFTSEPNVPSMKFAFDSMKLDFDRIGNFAVETMNRILNGEAVHRCILLDLDYESRGTVI